MLTHLDVARLQVFDNEGKILDGGKLYFFALGTTTPKETYQDINGTATNTNPVILDSVGSSQIYLNGSYTVSATDRYDVTIGPPVDFAGGINDFITSAGEGGFGSNIVVSVNNYAALRNISTNYAWVFVQGRETNADGGQGIFYYSTTPGIDDDGVTINSLAGTYIRYDVTKIDPRWFGLVYDSLISQEIYLEKSQVASERYNKSIDISGQVYINSNYTTSGYESSWILTGEFVSTLPITFTFTSNNKIVEIGKEVFGNTVQPIFSTGVLEKIKYTMFGASNVEGKVSKMFLSTSEPYLIEIDENIEIDDDFIIPDNFTLEINSTSTSGLVYINSNVSRDVTIKNITGNSIKENVIKFNSYSTVGDVVVPFEIDPKFFGAISTSAADTEILASFKAGNIVLEKSYFTSGNIVLNEDLKITSKLTERPELIFGGTLTTGKIEIENIEISATMACTSAYIKNSICVLGGLDSIYSEIKDSEVYGNVALISTTTKIDGIKSDCSFTGNVLECRDSQFSDYINLNSIFSGNFINCTFESLSVALYNTNVFGLTTNSTTNDPVFYLQGDNKINSCLFDSTVYQQLTRGFLGTTEFNSCAFGDKIIVSCGLGTNYIINNSVIKNIETHALIDNITNSSYYLSGADLTNNFTLVSGAVVSGSLTSASTKTPMTYSAGYMIFNLSGNYDYNLSGISDKACVRVMNSTDHALRLFKTYGGTVNISYKNGGNSVFKVVFARPHYKIKDHGLLYNISSLSAETDTRKVIYQTPYMSCPLEVSNDFSHICGYNNISMAIDNTGTPYVLSDIFGFRSQNINAYETLVDTNLDIAIVGYIEAGLQLNIQIEAKIPDSTKILETYYTQNTPVYNTIDTIRDVTFDGFNYVSSGVNNISNYWISNMKVEKNLGFYNIEGDNPNLYTQNIGESATYWIRYNIYPPALARYDWVLGYYKPVTSSSWTNVTEFSAFHITLNTQVSGTTTSAFPSKYEKNISENSFRRVAKTYY